MRLMIAVFIIVAILTGGCASWKKDAMKEPEPHYDPVTGETSYNSMTIFSTEDDEDDDLLPRFEDRDRTRNP